VANIIGTGIIGTGAIGAGGAPWTLYDDGSVVVAPGVVNWNHGTASPWDAHKGLVETITFEGSGYTIGPRTRSLFNDLPVLHTIVGLGQLDMSGVTYMNSMFRNTPSLVDVGDISRWDTSNVTSMAAMFFGASSLTALNLSDWNTQSVETMSNMFAGTTNLDVLDISNWTLPPTNANLSNIFSNSGLNTAYVGDVEARQWLLNASRWARVPPRTIILREVSNMIEVDGILQVRFAVNNASFAYLDNRLRWQQRGSPADHLSDYLAMNADTGFLLFNVDSNRLVRLMV